jgi:hypothetical protein
MDVKARSKAMREILTRLVEIEKGGVEVKLFGDVVILEEGEVPAYMVLILRHHPLASCRCSHLFLLD